MEDLGARDCLGPLPPPLAVLKNRIRLNKNMLTGGINNLFTYILYINLNINILQ